MARCRIRKINFSISQQETFKASIVVYLAHPQKYVYILFYVTTTEYLNQVFL